MSGPRNSAAEKMESPLKSEGIVLVRSASGRFWSTLTNVTMYGLDAQDTVVREPY